MASRPIAPATRSAGIRYAVRDIVLVAREAQRAGKELLYLNIGDPNAFDFETPPHIVEAICRAMRDNRTGYAPSEGLPEALDAIRQDAEERSGILNIQDVHIGSGCSECIELTLAALANQGDRVLVPAPGYPLYSAVLAKLGCVEVPYFLDEDSGWQPDLDDIAAKIDERTRAIVVINPNNPTGSVCSRQTLERLLELAAPHDLVVLADEIYDRLVLDDNVHVSLGALRDDVPIVTFNGLSKAYLGPGLRLGWSIVSGPAARVSMLVDAIHKFLRARLCASHPVQYAVVPALRSGQGHIKHVVEKLQRRRDITVSMLDAIAGIHCVPPQAAFYAFPRIEAGGDDKVWVEQVVRNTGVVVVHGKGFGQRPGTAHFRVVFLPPEETLQRAFNQIRDYMAER